MTNRKKFDIVWVSKHSDTVSLQLINHILKMPYVSSLEGYDPIEAESAKKSKYVFAISNFIKEKCEKDYKYSPEMITIGVDTLKFEKVKISEINKIKKKYCPNKEFLVLNVGRLVGPKDMETFVRAALEVSRVCSKIKFLICGNGPEKSRIIRLINEYKLQKKVFLISDLTDKEIVKYFRSADLFVHVPKSSNHFGVVYLEAMAAGLPIIAANEDATPHTVGNAAILVKKENPEEMSKAIIKLFKDRKLSTKLSKNARIKVEKEFNWEIIVDKLENFFEKAIRNNQSYNLDH